MKALPIYVETRIRAPLEAVWEKTQDPQEHEKWDLRFTRIEYLPKNSPSDPQLFNYETKIGFGFAVSGQGESVGEKTSDTERTSVLRFWSDNPISLIREGSGYWKYIALPDGSTRFLTWYDYEVRFGLAGKIIDRFIFRPIMGRATAWGFDALRLWLEADAQPREMRLRFWVDLWARLGLAAAWIYQGLVPKLLFPETGEREILLNSGADPTRVDAILLLIGGGQLLMGLLFLVLPHRRLLYGLTIGLLVMLGVGVLIQVPDLYRQPFNPASVSFAMGALAAAGWAASLAPVLPRAGRCRRKPRKRSRP